MRIAFVRTKQHLTGIQLIPVQSVRECDGAFTMRGCGFTAVYIITEVDGGSHRQCVVSIVCRSKHHKFLCHQLKNLRFYDDVGIIIGYTFIRPFYSHPPEAAVRFFVIVVTAVQSVCMVFPYPFGTVCRRVSLFFGGHIFVFRRMAEYIYHQHGTGVVGRTPEPLILHCIGRLVPCLYRNVDSPAVSVIAVNGGIPGTFPFRRYNQISPLLHIQRKTKGVFLHIPVVYRFFAGIPVAGKVQTISGHFIHQYRIRPIRMPQSDHGMSVLSFQIKPVIFYFLSAHRNNFFCGYIQFQKIFVSPAFQYTVRCKPCQLAFLFQNGQFGVGDVGSFLLTGNACSVRLGSKILCGCFLCHAVSDIGFHGGEFAGLFCSGIICRTFAVFSPVNLHFIATGIYDFIQGYTNFHISLQCCVQSSIHIKMKLIRRAPPHPPYSPVIFLQCILCYMKCRCIRMLSAFIHHTGPGINRSGFCQGMANIKTEIQNILFHALR